MKKLIVFDTEGVVIQGVWLIALFRRLGLSQFFKFAILALLYKLRIRDFNQTITTVYLMAKGVTKEVMVESFQESRGIWGVKQTIRTLQKNDYFVALTSSGVPHFIIEDIAKKLKADVGFGLNLEFKNEVFTGRVYGPLARNDGKSRIVRKIRKQYGLPKEKSVSVSNDRNNLSMFGECSSNIAFNPDFDMRKESNYIVTTRDLRKILPLVIPKYKLKKHPLKLKTEAKRKLVHISGLLLIPIWIFLPEFVIGLTLSVTMLYAFSEIVRLDGYYVPIISEITLELAREEERSWFIASPIWYAVGILITFTAFPAPASFVGIIALVIGDTFSALTGIRFGKHKTNYNKNKSYEGMIGFIIPTFLLLLLLTNVYIALLVSIIAAIIETLPIPANDNIIIPISASGLYYVLRLLLPF
ncbi:MAG: haloacid dehalogenase-like hydrolase [Candidatus Ranarchaeia archaeon]